MAEIAINRYKIIAIGGSAGSLDAVLKIVSALPASTTICVLIIIHRKNDSESILANLLATRTTLYVKEIEDKEPICGATVYIAPADYHVLIENEQLFSLDTSEKIHHSRPSIDVSFESVAEVFGKTAIGILLSGANADGASGLSKIKQAEGLTIVQDPASADVDFMPQQAIEMMQPDEILDAGAIAAFIQQLLNQQA